MRLLDADLLLLALRPRRDPRLRGVVGRRGRFDDFGDFVGDMPRSIISHMNSISARRLIPWEASPTRIQPRK